MMAEKRKVDVLAGEGSVAGKLRKQRQQKQTFLDEVMKEFSGQGMGPAGKRK